MALDLGALQAELTMDVSGFTKGISEAVGGLSGLAKNINDLADNLTEAAKGLGNLGTAVKNLGKATLTLLANPIVLIAGVIAGFVALGKAAYDAFVEIDAAYDAIEIATGAVGESLDELKQSFDSVYTNATYVESAEALAATMGDLSTYLGVAGEQLETLASQISNLQGMGFDASVDKYAQAMNKWGVSTEDMSGYLDYFAGVSQATGISIDSLNDALTQSQATLSTFGFSLQESANLLGLMNKGGIETSQLNTALKQLTANGITTREQFDALTKSIRNATTQEEKLAIASGAFGMRVKDEMVGLIESGLFDNLSEDIDNSAGRIENLAKSTEDFGDKMNRLGRNMTSFGAQAGDVINTVLGKVFDFFEWTSGLFAKIMEPFQKLFAKIGESFAKFWGDGEDTSGDAIGNIMGFIEMLVDGIAAGIDWFLTFVYPTIEYVIQQIVTVIKLFSAVFAGDWDEAWKQVLKISLAGSKMLNEIFGFCWDGIMDGLQWLIQQMVNGIFDVINTMLSVIAAGINEVLAWANNTGLFNFQSITWHLEAPEIPELTRWSDTDLSKNFEEYIAKLEDQIDSGDEEEGGNIEPTSTSPVVNASGVSPGTSKNAGVTPNSFVFNINGDVTNPSEMAKKIDRVFRLGV